MEAIVLAGGLGTRLRSIISDVPKPMAPIDNDNTPFLEVIMKNLKLNGVTHVVLSIGYKGNIIKEYFGDSYNGMHVDYSFEHEPLLTGGAIKKAKTLCNEKDFFIINGDTFLDIDYKNMYEYHKKNDSKLTMAIKKTNDVSRYGTVDICNGNVKSFQEKGVVMEGMINAGVYCMNDVLSFSDFGNKFSFEKDFLQKTVMKIFTYEVKGKFLDIGVPTDYMSFKQMYADNEIIFK